MTGRAVQLLSLIFLVSAPVDARHHDGDAACLIRAASNQGPSVTAVLQFLRENPSGEALFSEFPAATPSPSSLERGKKLVYAALGPLLSACGTPSRQATAFLVTGRGALVGMTRGKDGESLELSEPAVTFMLNHKGLSAPPIGSARIRHVGDAVLMPTEDGKGVWVAVRVPSVENVEIQIRLLE